MSVNRRPPVKRAPITLPLCRGCRGEITPGNTTWDVERRTFVHSCGATDPANSTPERQAAEGEAT